MLRSVLRRLLWLPPTLIVVTLVTFAVLTSSGSPFPRGGAFSSLPRFFNAHPADARVRADAAVSALAVGPSPDAAGALAALGGAALPIVLARLPALAPEGRGRVAVALAPIAKRMGVGTDDELADPIRAASFWASYGDDRALDLTDAAVRRAVRRFIDHPTPMHARDVRLLDTLAADALIDAITTASPADRERVLRLALPAFWRALGVDQGELTHADDRALERSAAQARARWMGDRLGFVILDGTGRALATILETQYAKWATRTLEGDLGATPDGTPLFGELFARAAVTFPHAVAGSLLGHGVGLLLALLTTADRRRLVTRLLRAALAFGFGSPLLFTTAANGALLVLLVAAPLALGAFTAGSERLHLAFAEPYLLHERAFGASAARVRARALLRRVAPAALAEVIVDLPLALTFAIVLEGDAGLRPLVVRAVETHDIAALLVLAAVGSSVAAVGFIIVEVARFVGDPRPSRGEGGAVF